MKIAVFGIGYVGTVSAACFAARGHDVIAVDLDQTKVDAINGGRSPVIERGVDDLVGGAVRSGKLRASTDAAGAVAASELSLVCVGTPTGEGGGLNLDYVARVSQEIGAALRERPGYHVVVFRSTMIPGVAQGRLIPVLEEASGKRAGVDFGVAVNPEFLREGSSIDDFNDPPRTVIGAFDDHSGDIVASLYADLSCPLVRTDLKTAEMVKYADNSFHALKIAFANEIGNLCKREGIDGHELMDIFCLDTKLNLSPMYLRPGFAFGGSCLPKDLRALAHHARRRDVQVPLIEAILESNEVQKRLGLSLVLRTKKRQVGLLGLSFKPGTDDLRESPAVELAEALIGKGLDIAIYDKNVSLARLVGANRAYIEREIPHISRLMRGSVAEVCDHAEVLVVSTRDPEFADVPAKLRPGQVLIDLVRLGTRPPASGQYEGISW